MKEEQGEELCIIADDCPGQNENNTTMRLALLLAEKKFFLRVTFAFCVAGHTKNSCDRWFDSLKRVSRSSNLFTMEQLKEKFGESERMTVAIVVASDFHDCATALDAICKRINKKGFVQNDHLFQVHSIQPTALWIVTSTLLVLLGVNVVEKSPLIPTKPMSQDAGNVVLKEKIGCVSTTVLRAP